MNNATKVLIYKARAIFSEQRFKKKNVLFPKREGTTGKEGEASLDGLGIKPPFWLPNS